MNIIIKPVWLLMENIVQNEIGHEQFGIYAALYSFGLMFYVLSDMGINQYLTKELASRPIVLKTYLPTILSFKLLISFIYPFFMLFAGFVLGYRGIELYYLFILSIIHALFQIILFYRAKFQAFQDFTYDSFASILDKTLLFGIVLFLLTLKIDLESFIFARLTSTLISFFILGYFLFKKYGWFGIGYDKANIKVILKDSFPFALIALVYSVHERVDQVMLERLASDHVTGLYAASYRWVDACMMYLWTILPFFFARFSFFHKEPHEQQKIFDMGLIISNIPMVFICGFVFFYGDKLFWLYGNSTQAELDTMTMTVKFLFASVLIHGFFSIAGTYLTSSGYVNFINKMMVFSIFLNISINFLLIAEWGTMAAAFSTFISTLFLSVSYVVYINRHVALNYSFNIFIRLFINAVLFFLALYFLDKFLEWYFAILISGIFLLLISFITGLIKKAGLLDKKVNLN